MLTMWHCFYGARWQKRKHCIDHRIKLRSNDIQCTNVPTSAVVGIQLSHTTPCKATKCSQISRFGLSKSEDIKTKTQHTTYMYTHTRQSSWITGTNWFPIAAHQTAKAKRGKRYPRIDSCAQMLVTDVVSLGAKWNWMESGSGRGR